MAALARRHFLKTTGMGAGGIILGAPAIVRGRNLNSRIHVGCIGVGGKGMSDVRQTAAAGGHIVALCDVDSRRLGITAANFPEAAGFADFREMLAVMDRQIDAVTISTPDHLHGIAATMAMRMGKHVYCQKPLTQTVFEARELRRIASEGNLATQMGNQGSALDGLRHAIEVIRAGVIGKVSELHIWSDRPIWPQGTGRPEGSDPVPAELDWNLWLGPVKQRPYLDKAYHPFNWRGWTDFGAGALGDMACHSLNMPFRALNLGYPSVIECEMASRIFSETYPLTSRIRFEFPERDGLPPVRFWWYDGSPDAASAPLRPYPDIVKDVIKLRGKLPSSGCLVIGDKGRLFSPDDYGAMFFIQLEGEEGFIQGRQHEAVKAVAQTIPRSPGHYVEWIEMIRTGKPAYSTFEVGGMLTEVILLGCIALRLGEGVRMEWDGPNMRSPSHPEAERFIRREERTDW